MKYGAAGWLMIVLAPAFLWAADPLENSVTGWIARSGGAFVTAPSGDVTEVSLRAAWINDSDLVQLTKLPKLQQLDLSLTHISDRALDPLKELPALAGLDLTYAEGISDSGLARLRSVKNLQRLVLEGTQVSDSGISSLAALGNLRVLNLRCTQITDAALESLEPLTGLEELTIGGNRVTGKGLGYLKALRGLKYLDLSGVQSTDNGLWSVHLTDLGMETLAGLTGLETLSLAQREIPDIQRYLFKDVLEVVRMQVTDLGMEKLQSLLSLRSLDLTGAQVTSAGLEALARIPGIERLVLAYDHSIDDSALISIAKLPHLKLLDIRATGVTDAGVREFSAFKELKAVYLSGSKVSAKGAAALRALRPDCEVLRSE